MDWVFFGRGLLVGFAIAAPVGPIGLLCIQRTLAHGQLTGLVTGLGAATADAAYGLVAGLGLTAVAIFLREQRIWLGVVGGLFLCYLGVRTLLSAPASESAVVKSGLGLWGAYVSTLLLTLTNPLTIFSFIAVFAGLGLGTDAATQGGTRNAFALVAGVFTGSALWWSLLSGVTALLRRRVSPAMLMWVNRTAGVILVGFGAYLLLGLMG